VISNYKDYKDNLNNIFYSNWKFYKFPYLLHKNLIDYDEVIYKQFKEFLFEVCNSTLLKDIYICEEFSSFEYPLSNKKIFEEMMENTIFIPTESIYLHGFTQKKLLSVFISTRLKDNYKVTEFSNLIVDIGHIFNTIMLENIRYYIKGLLFFNSFRYNIQQNIGSNHNLQNSENIFLEGLIKMKNKNKN